MKHEMVFLGKAKESFIQAGIAEYSGRLNHYTKLSTRVLKEKKSGRGNSTVEEGRMLLESVPAGWLVVALDPKGKQLTSEQLAELISAWEQRGIKGASYLIGGPLGLSGEVIERADICLSLSKMTFTHDMARLFMVEQLYRAYTIKAGEKYHK